MKGYWHIPALATAASGIAVIFESYLCCILFFWVLLSLYVMKRLGKLPILFSLICFLFFYYHIPILTPPAEIPHIDSSIQGEIVSPIIDRSKTFDFVLQPYQSNQKILVVFFKDDQSVKPFPGLQHGASCAVQGDLEIPESSTNPGQFNYQKHLLSKGISYQMILHSKQDVQCHGASKLAQIFALRAKLKTYINERVSPETAAWFYALVLGDDSHIDEDIIDLFQDWNLSHLLAISGLHVGLVTALVYFILIKSNVLTREKAQWLMILFLPIYAFLAGGEPSVIRASTTVLLFLIFNKLKWRITAMDVLSIVFILLVAVDRYIVYHIGFQFSFLVTFGLLLSRRWLSQSTSYVFSVLQISFVSQMMILPLQLAYFSTFHPLSILLNVVIVPYFTLFVIPSMFLLLLFSPLTFIVNLFDQLFVPIHRLFIAFIELVDQMAFYPMILGALSAPVIVIYYILFFAFMYYLQVKKSRHAFYNGILISVFLVLLAIRPYFSPVGTVTMLDIGQGDAYVLELPYRKGVIFIDAGAQVSFSENNPTDKVYQQIIKPYLYSRGIAKIDAVFLSHEDMDHDGSTPYLIEEMSVDQIFVSSLYEPPDYMVHVLQKEDKSLQRVDHAERMTIGGYSFYILSPEKDGHSANDNSLIIYTEIGGKKWLFTGDAGKKVEKNILQKYPDLQIDVLKVGHHGSQTSTDPAFINRIEPEVALISVGRNNMYNHPASDVLDTLKKAGVQIFRTDTHGAVQYRFQYAESGTFFKYLP